MPKRIRVTDQFGNVAYIHLLNGQWHCTLSNGIPAGFEYAGIRGDEVGFIFALEDAKDDQERLRLVQQRVRPWGGSPQRYTVELV